MDKHARIYVAGHAGLVGSALRRLLKASGYSNLVTRRHAELDLTDQRAVQRFFEAERPDHVLLAAARVGGILANDTYPAEFIQQNLAIQSNVIHESWRHGVKRLLFLGSSCIYPRDCPQPIKEEYLLTGPLEKTNQAYALAKIAGIEMCRAYNRQYGTEYFCVMPTNLYGIGDNFDLETSHLLPALIRKVHEAKVGGRDEVVAWGSGSPRRELLNSDDLASACLFLLRMDWGRLSAGMTSDCPLFNVGSGEEHSIRDIVTMVADVLGFRGSIRWDSSKPDGTPRKILDSSRIRSFGWKPTIELREGIARTYAWYIAPR